MQVSARKRESRSKLRQSLAEKLAVWVQRENDPDAVLDLEKVAFARQEQAKLRKELRALSRGVAKQRDWADGKLIY